MSYSYEALTRQDWEDYKLQEVFNAKNGLYYQAEFPDVWSVDREGRSYLIKLHQDREEPYATLYYFYFNSMGEYVSLIKRFDFDSSGGRYVVYDSNSALKAAANKVDIERLSKLKEALSAVNAPGTDLPAEGVIFNF